MERELECTVCCEVGMLSTGMSCLLLTMSQVFIVCTRSKLPLRLASFFEINKEAV